MRKAYYIAWKGAPCSHDGTALNHRDMGEGNPCGVAELKDLEVYLTADAAFKQITSERGLFYLGDFSVEEFEF